MLKIEFRKVTIKKLEKKLRQAKKIGNGGQIQKICAILMLAKGLSIAKISEIWCICERTMYDWIYDYLSNGMQCFKIVKRPGRKARLNGKQKEKLKEIIDNGPEEYGLDVGCWNSVMIKQIIRKEFKIDYHRNYVCELLRNLGYSYQKGKFTPVQADEKQRQDWLIAWPDLLTQARSLNAHLLFVDEVSFPMWGSLGRTWSKKGQQPLVKTCGKRKNLKVFGAIDYLSGRFVYKSEEAKLTMKTYICFLKTIMRRFSNKIFLIHDGAPYHRGKLVKDFVNSHRRIECYQLPKYSPDYNLIEFLWKKSKSRVHGKYFENFCSLKKAVASALRYFQRNVDEIISIDGVYLDFFFDDLLKVS